MKPIDNYIIALDQGTTSSRALLVNQKGQIVDMAQREFPQAFPQPGWVEHDPMQLWNSQRQVLEQVLSRNALDPKTIAAIGITNQRETTLLWDRRTGNPIYPAIVWQDKRTAALCQNLVAAGLSDKVRERTGLVIDSYFSATKIMWMLKEVPGARELANQGHLAFGTVDTWLIWNLTRGEVHATDVTNASRTMLFNLHTMQWDAELLKAFEIPDSLLPEVRPCTAHFGDAYVGTMRVPILGVAGDQQAALFGQTCFSTGMAKNTYGTGCFMLMNTGTSPKVSSQGLLTTLAWQLEGQAPHYAFEGSVFMAGAAVQWLRDGLKLIDQSVDSEYFALKALGSDQVYVVPAFAGLGAPYWDMYARGAIFGLTRDTGKDHIVKATLEAIAYQTKDVLMAMEIDAGIKVQRLHVDGGACVNNLLMQFQADILDCEVERPQQVESTALGAAYLAGIKEGLWDQERLISLRTIDRVFSPSMDAQRRDRLYARWKKAVERTLGWDA